MVGFSMGGMVATKLASARPLSVRSLLLISVSGGGRQIIPLSAKALRCVVRGAVNKGELAESTVKLLFSKDTRQRPVGAQRLGDLLVQEYRQSAATSRPRQEGEVGHLSACWSHEVTQRDADCIRGAGFPVTVIHGRHDLLAMPKYAARLAERLGARLVLMDGGHFVPRKCAAEVSQQLLATVLAHSLRLPPRRPSVSSPGRASPRSCRSEGTLASAASATSCTAAAAASPSFSNSEGGLSSGSHSQLSWLPTRHAVAGGLLRCRAKALMERAHRFMPQLRDRFSAFLSALPDSLPRSPPSPSCSLESS